MGAWSRILVSLALFAMLFVLLLAFVARGRAHEWYPNQCCSGQDCRPVPAGESRYDATGLWVLIEKEWRLVPPDKIQAMPSPDNKLHVCYRRAPPYDILCVFVPPST